MSVSVPESWELLQFFGSEPREESLRDGYWSYEVVDARGTKLRFSFDIVAKSVQVVLSHSDEETITVSYEGLASIVLRGTSDRPVLIAETRSRDTDSELLVELTPHIHVRWATLLLAESN